jgi:type VI secretion system protein ImpH
LDLSFPATEIVDFDDTGRRPELTLSLMGLIGVSGVMPGHYSQWVLEAYRDNNPVPRDFLDMFNHRALSLFVRAAGKYRLPLAFERGGSRGDSISASLLALIGMRGPALQGRQAVSDETLVFYAGHFAQHRRSAGGLQQMLSDRFERPIGVAQFQGRWADLLPSEQTRLGGAGQSGGYATVGADAVVGSRVWDVQGSFRVTLGPLDYSKFLEFMPGAAQMRELAAMTRSYVGPALSFDVQLTLKGTEVPPLRLTVAAAPTARLGWNTWLPTRGARGDARDAVFRMDVDQCH